MTERPDRQLAALERRLEQASLPKASPSLRRRVVSAIDDVLREDVPAARPRLPRHPGLPVSPDALAGTALASVLATIVAAVALSIAAVAEPAAPLTLDARARIAGVGDAALGPLVAERHRASPAVRSSRPHEAPTCPDTLRVLDGRHLLQETF